MLAPLLLAVSSPALVAPTLCPVAIVAKAVSKPGKTTRSGQRSHPLIGMDVTSGDPADKLIIKPEMDGDRQSPVMSYDVSGGGFYATCRYFGTRETVVGKIPVAIKRCSVSYGWPRRRTPQIDCR